jgi:hypothetical protein
MGLFDDDELDSKRTLGIRDKQILYRKANKKCQNPACGKEIDFDEMQVGHKKAWCKGGKTTLKDSVCLCYRCNKLQGTDSWAVFLSKRGVRDKSETIKNMLEALSLPQLKLLAKQKGIKLKSRQQDEGWLATTTITPGKKQYINKLKDIVTEKDIELLKSVAPPKKKKRKSRSSDFGLW